MSAYKNIEFDTCQEGFQMIYLLVFSLEMSCLMEALQDKRVRLQPECKKRLQDRIDMWSYAAKVNLSLSLSPLTCTHRHSPRKALVVFKVL